MTSSGPCVLNFLSFLFIFCRVYLLFIQHRVLSSSAFPGPRPTNSLFGKIGSDPLSQHYPSLRSSPSFLLLQKRYSRVRRCYAALSSCKLTRTLPFSTATIPLASSAQHLNSDTPSSPFSTDKVSWCQPLSSLVHLARVSHHHRHLICYPYTHTHTHTHTQHKSHRSTAHHLPTGASYGLGIAPFKPVKAYPSLVLFRHRLCKRPQHTSLAPVDHPNQLHALQHHKRAALFLGMSSQLHHPSFS